MAAGLVALAPATASADGFRDAHVYVQSAKSGELSGSRLTLYGVGRRVTWAAHPGHFGMVPIRRLHHVLFTRRTTTATGTLDVADQRGRELVLRLSRPRYNASRATVSYRAKPLNNASLPGRAARGSGMLRRFGAASLSIVGAPQVTVGNPEFGHDCTVRIFNATGRYIQLQSFSAWDTDNQRYTPRTDLIESGDPDDPGDRHDEMAWWQTVGPDLRGCGNTAKFKFQNGDDATVFTVHLEWPWGSDPSWSCTPPSGYHCVEVHSDVIEWEFRPGS